MALTKDKDQDRKIRQGDVDVSPPRRTDVQAAITIIGRRSDMIRERGLAENWDLDISNANLTGYNLSKLKFDVASFRGTVLSRSTMYHCDFNQCDFSDSCLCGARISFSTFKFSTLVNVDLKDTDIVRTEFERCTFVNANILQGKFKGIRFDRTDLREAFDSYLPYVAKKIVDRKMEAHDGAVALSIVRLFENSIIDEYTSMLPILKEAYFVIRPEGPPRLIL